MTRRKITCLLSTRIPTPGEEIVWRFSHIIFLWLQNPSKRKMFWGFICGVGGPHSDVFDDEKKERKYAPPPLPKTPPCLAQPIKSPVGARRSDTRWVAIHGPVLSC